MKPTLRLIWASLIILLYQQTVCGKPDNFTFSPIVPQTEYFSNRMAGSLLQDSRGYLWAGSLDGLIRYDGTEFVSFNKSDLHTASSAVCCIFEDSIGNLWIGTEKGLSRFSIATGTFDAMDTPSSEIDSKVACVREDKLGRIWFSLKSKGIWSYDPASGDFDHYLYDPDDGNGAPKINSFIIDDNGNVIISVYCDGLYICRDGFETVEPLEVSGFDFAGDDFSCMTAGERNVIYAVSGNLGLCEILPYAGKVKVLTGLDGGVHATDLYNDCVRGMLYMSTTRGLYALNLADGAGVDVVYDRTNTSGLPSDSFSCVTVDMDGGIVAGLKTGNVYYNSPQNDYIVRYDKLSTGEPLTNCDVKKFAEDPDGNIMVLSSEKGLMKLNPRTGVLEVVPGVPKSCEDILYEGKSMWLSAGSSLYLTDIESGRRREFSYDYLKAGSLVNRSIYPIVGDCAGSVYFGTALGVIVYDENTRTFAHLPGLDECNVNGICMDGNMLLLSTYAHGLVKYDLVHKAVVRFPDDAGLLELTGLRLNGVLKDEMGRVFVATSENGVVVIGPDGELSVTDTGSTFGYLKSNNVKSILKDYSGTLWVATEDGLTSISSNLQNFDHFAEADGLLNNYFLPRRGFVSDEGTLYFGSRDGFIALYPDRVRKSRKGSAGSLYLDGIKVGNSILVPGPGSELSESVERTRRIVLRHDRNSLSFKFSHPSLPSSSDSYVMCKMDGLDREWVRLGEGNEFICREMPPGKYKLLARYYDNAGEMKFERLPLEIDIRPPFWASVTAKVIYVLIFLGIFSYVTLMLMNKVKAKEEKRYKALMEEQLAATPERKMLRSAQIGQSPAFCLRENMNEDDRKFVSKLDMIIAKNIADENLSYSMVAEQMCIGKQTLNLKVKNILGVTVSNYILLTRLFASVPMLSEADSRVNVVCFKVGFNTPSYFAKCFKNGLTCKVPC